MKETFYFSHDYSTRSDEKIKLLIRKHGMLGYGVFWSIIEDLYLNANALRTDYEGISYDLRIDENIVKSIINDFDLFVINDGFFGSESVERRISERNDKSVKARKSAISKWEKIRENANAQKKEANAIENNCEGNAIKESKGKESKVKEISIVNFSEKTENSPDGEFLKSLSLKTKIYLPTLKEAQDKFEIFRKDYPGKKDGLNVAFEQFLNGKNPLSEIDLLLQALEAEKRYMAYFPNRNWKNLKTWIQDKCWTQSLPDLTKNNVEEVLTYKEVVNKSTATHSAFEDYRRIGEDKWVLKNQTQTV